MMRFHIIGQSHLLANYKILYKFEQIIKGRIELAFFLFYTEKILLLNKFRRYGGKIGVTLKYLKNGSSTEWR